jgi:predicted RNase H-like HicB family nuclease
LECGDPAPLSNSFQSFGESGKPLEPADKTMKQPTFTVSDGKLVLTLTTAEEGGYIVTSPLDPELITEAETLEEAFENARDAAKALRQARRKLETERC